MPDPGHFDPVSHLIELAGARPRVVVAYSGGLDSTVLAHALVRQRRKLGGLRLVHVDHGLQEASFDWSRHCARQAQAWKVPYRCLTARVRVGRGESLEAAAREARYALLADELVNGEVLVTAQHRDDQAETLLLQLFRGAGVQGLAAMPARASFAKGRIVRPLLGYARTELERYAAKQRLTWVEDPTNRLERFGRNFLRHRVVPLLRERWTGVDAAIARSARHMAEAGTLLDELARRDLWAVADGDGLNVAALRRLQPERRRNVLRAHIARAGHELPSTVKLREIAGSLLAARADAQPEVSWPGSRLLRRAGRLVLEPQSAHQPGSARPRTGRSEIARKSWHWKNDRELVLNERGDVLTLVDDSHGAVDLDRLPGILELRPRQGGETLRPAPNARTRALKKLLQAAKLGVEERAGLPLLFAAENPREGLKGRLIAAGDRWLDASVMANVKSRRRARLVWTKKGAG